MAFAVQTEAPPIREDSSGALRVGNTRVLLSLVVRAFQSGAAPEEIIERYTTLTLADVYAVIAYYLRHRDEVDAYMARCDERAAEWRKKIESEQGNMSEIRARLLARKQARE